MGNPPAGACVWLHVDVYAVTLMPRTHALIMLACKGVRARPAARFKESLRSESVTPPSAD